jgi:medium-chain acyl-[acyl-carrier-protein] hydrolase
MGSAPLGRGANGRRPGVLVCPVERPDADVRLVCFPYAGGSPVVFRAWSSGLAEVAEVIAMQPPGRGHLGREPACEEVAALVARVTPEIALLADKQLALFGHSMGALVAFEVARALRRVHGVTPLCLFVSGFPAPQLSRPETRIHELPTRRFWDEIRRLGGTPLDILADEEIKRLVEPSLRADFAALERYRYEQEAPLECPIAAYRGEFDPTVTGEQLTAWLEQTEAEFCSANLPGDHFYLHSEREVLVETIGWELRRLRHFYRSSIAGASA